jgi:hypothetical protein
VRVLVLVLLVMLPVKATVVLPVKVMVMVTLNNVSLRIWRRDSTGRKQARRARGAQPLWLSGSLGRWVAGCLAHETHVRRAWIRLRVWECELGAVVVDARQGRKARPNQS